MARHDKTPHFGRELSEEELHQAGGGYNVDIDDWCGTKPRIPFPRPRPWLQFEQFQFEQLLIAK
jgi:hypothetical protein